MANVGEHLKNVHLRGAEFHNEQAAKHNRFAQSMRKFRKVDEEAQDGFEELAEQIADFHKGLAADHLREATYYSAKAAEIDKLSPQSMLPQMVAHQPYLDRTHKAALPPFQNLDGDAMVPDHVIAIAEPPPATARAVPRYGQPPAPSAGIPLELQKIIPLDLNQERP